ncbi:MAG: acyl-CoA dehydrogenase family protein [Chloroflexi bacterium]|nr:acyl-CoA dehydrogenase family protein [Chloroflexota bacterium]
MNFALTPEEDEFRAGVRKFLGKQMARAPAGPWPQDTYFSIARRIREGLGGRGRSALRPCSGQAGSRQSWLTLAWPCEHGGEDSPIKDAILREEMAYFGVPRANDYGTNLAGPLTIRYGTGSQKARHLGPLANGKEWWCIGFTEPMAGSDLAAIRTRAVDMGDHYLLTGQKDYVEWARESDWCCLLARTDPDSSGSAGLTLFLLDMKSPGIFLNPVAYMTGRSFAELFLDQVRVPKEGVLGGVGRGWEVAKEVLEEGRSGIEFVGWGRRILDLMIEGAASEGGGSVGPVVRHKLAEAAMDIEVARLLSYRSVRNRSRGRASTSEVSKSKLFGSEMCQRVAGTAMEVRGLAGQMARDNRWGDLGWMVHDHFIESIAGTIYLGSSEMQRDLIAHRQLGLPH